MDGEPTGVPESANSQETEQRSRELFLVGLYERGLSEGEDTIGYHGTSLESMQYLLRIGSLPGYTTRTEHDPHLPQLGDLYFAPIPERFPDRNIVYSAITTPLNDGVIYAAEAARSYNLARLLRVDISDPHYYSMIHSITLNANDFQTSKSLGVSNWDDDAQQYLNQLAEDLGLSDATIQAHIRRSLQRQGVVLTISKEALQQYEVLPGDQPDDLRLRCPEGFDYRFFNGLQPMGRDEIAMFDNMRRQVRGL